MLFGAEWIILKRKILSKRGDDFVNRILKQRARQLYGQNFGRLFAVYLLHLFYLLATTLPATLLQDRLIKQGVGEWWSFLFAAAVQSVLLLFLGPLALGVDRFTYFLQKDRKPGIGETFYYFTGGKRYFKAVGAGFIQLLPTYLTLAISSAMDGSAYGTPLEFVLDLLLIAAYVFLIYWTLHICLLPYILAEDENAQLGHIRRESFRLMKGNCGRYFGLNLSFFGWYALIVAVVTVVIVVIMFPTLSRAIEIGMPDIDSVTEPFTLWAEVAVYALMIFLNPYVGLAGAGFGDAALQGRLEELAWQGRMPYNGYYPPVGAGWQQPYPPQYPPYPPQYPPYPQGGPQTTSWQSPPQAPAWNQPPQQPAGGSPYTAAQQEEALQYQRYRQGQPMEPRSFVTYGLAAEGGSFLPWVQVEQSGLYSLLKLESWMPGMVAAAWQQAAAALSAQPLDSGAAVKRSLEETLSGSRFRVTVIISDDGTRPGYRQVCIRVDLNPPA